MQELVFQTKWWPTRNSCGPPEGHGRFRNAALFNGLPLLPYIRTDCIFIQSKSKKYILPEKFVRTRS